MAIAKYLFRAPKRRLPMQEIESAEVVSDRGFKGCCHGRPGSRRQVLLVDQETLDAMSLAPGIIRENITTEGLNVNGLTIGEKLQIGETLLEVSAICTPCNQLEAVRTGLRRELYGRRGMLCRVLKGGAIRKGDAIERVGESAAAPA